MFARSFSLITACIALSSLSAQARSIPARGLSSVFSGRVAIVQTDGTQLGFLGNSENGFPNLDSDDIASVDLEVEITVSGNGPFDLLATNPAWTGSPLIGGGTDTTLALGLSSAVPLVNVTQTPAGSPPTPGGASAIWDFDAPSAQLTPLWTNPDGSQFVPIILFHRESNLLLFTGDEADIDGRNNLAVEFFVI